VDLIESFYLKMFHTTFIAARLRYFAYCDKYFTLRLLPGLHKIASQKIFEVGRKKWRVKLKSLKRKKSKEKERKEKQKGRK
jgi:hypothetical protein